jgi:hypothetical protein
VGLHDRRPPWESTVTRGRLHPAERTCRAPFGAVATAARSPPGGARSSCGRWALALPTGTYLQGAGRGPVTGRSGS